MGGLGRGGMRKENKEKKEVKWTEENYAFNVRDRRYRSDMRQYSAACAEAIQSALHVRS